MTDTNTKPTSHRVPPADASAPFFTFANLFRSEMTRVLEETSAAMEKGYGEWERTVQEASRFQAAQARAMQEASKAFVSGARVMLG